MQAICFPSKDTTETGEIPDPVAGPGEVVIAVRASGICHTDIEVRRGNYGSSAFPIVPGHEYAGEIVETGAGVEGVQIGDRVVVDPNIECGTCAPCRRGWAHLCERLGAYGVTVNGGFAEKSVVRASAAHPIGDMSYGMAALAEPVGCVLNGLSPLKDRIIDRALIFGAGPMGLLMGLTLKAQGIGEVIAIDRNEARLEIASAFGITGHMAAAPELAGLRQAFDLTVDATGAPEVASGLLDYTANGGAALFFGVCPQDARIEVSPFEVFRRQLSLFGTHSLNHNIPQALETIRAIGPEIGRVVTHSLPMDDVANIFAGRSPATAMKVQMAL